MKALTKSITLLFALLLFAPTFAQHPPKPGKVKAVQKYKWEKLGSKTVNMKADTDHLLVTAYEGTFTKVKFHVAKAPIHVKSITVVFGNGEKQHFNIDKNFPKGTDSKVFDLPGNKRIIQKIKFEYTTIDNGKGKAVVTAWGKH